MAFVFDEVCDFQIPAYCFDSGSDLYGMVVLAGYNYSGIQVVDHMSMETIPTTTKTNSRMMTVAIRIPRCYLGAGRVLLFMTPERVMPDVYTSPTQKTGVTWSGVFAGGANAWKWVVPRGV